MSWESRRVAIRSFTVIAIALLAACSTHESLVAPAAPLSPASSVRDAGQWSAHVFITFQEGPSGGEPDAGLTRDSAGNLYGTTVFGGNQSCQSYFDFGCGVVFKIDPSGTESVVDAFPPPGGTDGRYPEARVILDRNNNIYGTTPAGGNESCASGGSGGGCGTVFKIDRAGSESVLYSFNGGKDGESPDAGVARDSAGNLYGTTYRGGGSGCRDSFGDGCGVVYKLSEDGVETVLHRFAGSDGGAPVADLLLDQAGNAYGTTEYGGTGHCNIGVRTGCGTLFEVRKNGKFSVLYNFSGMKDGASPQAGLLADSAGNLYGTAYYGGDLTCKLREQAGCGVVFKLDKAGKETALHTFEGGTDGALPISNLVGDPAGNLYGTTTEGGNPNCPQPSLGGCGVVFKLDRHNRETMLYSLTDSNDGETPVAGVVRDPAGNLYGTSLIGIYNYGAAFEVSPK
jgi:uncharacterized repeat protein (TIGR03803 family)